jgi:hypothetical protein
MVNPPIPIALPYNPPDLTNNKPQESKEMVLLRSMKELKEKQNLEKHRIAQFWKEHPVNVVAKAEALGKKYMMELMNAKLDSL